MSPCGVGYLLMVLGLRARPRLSEKLSQSMITFLRFEQSEDGQSEGSSQKPELKISPGFRELDRHTAAFVDARQPKQSMYLQDFGTSVQNVLPKVFRHFQ
jgi:hypothetical protein